MSEHSHHNHDHNYNHDHEHEGHSHHGHSHAPQSRNGLVLALIITGGIMILEFFGGLITGSLALLSDSGHMLSDTFSLALSLVAMLIAVRPASRKLSYGYHRFEIMAALFNAVTLFLIAGFIIYEAYERFSAPPIVASGSMMAIASVGLLANLVSAWMLVRKSNIETNINIRSAYLHVLGDALGSVGALAAGLIMQLTSWYAADPIISVLVALLILRSAWNVLKQVFHILMEGTPPHLDAGKVREALQDIGGVVDVHDLHIWTIASGLDALSCHILIRDEESERQILQEAVSLVEEKFGIHHVTIQLETAGLQHRALKV